MALGYVWAGENQVILAQKLIPFLFLIEKISTCAVSQATPYF